MKIAVSSVGGDPRDPRTWSNAPAHLIAALENAGHEVTAIDSSRIALFAKGGMAIRNLARGFPSNVVSWFEPARRRRGRYVAARARAAGCELVICTGTLDAPVGLGIEYAIWMDNTFSLLQRSAVALDYSTPALDEIERLERLALHGAVAVLPFSSHVGESVVHDYDVSPERVHVVGCGAGPLSPFRGQKDFAESHLLFVAKHLFSSKGGDLLLAAFPRIRAVRPHTKLVLVGNDEAEQKARGIDGVEVYGFVDRAVLDRLYYQAAMLVQPMLADPWGQVYLEAMKARAVVVGLDNAALPELTDSGRLGVLIASADPQLLADAVLATFDRCQADLDAMTTEAQLLAETRFNWEAVAERVIHAIQAHTTDTATPSAASVANRPSTTTPQELCGRPSSHDNRSLGRQPSK